MTRLEKELQEAKDGNGVEVLKRRKAELDRLEKAGRECRNWFRRDCIAQEYDRKKKEYDKIDELF